MAVIRVNKNKDYTVMSNYHFKEKTLSLKAKGLLSEMLSLPENWDYSINGLVSMCKESKTSIQSTLKELENHKYLKRTRIQNEMGQFEYIYDIFEKPYDKKQETEKPCTENPCTDNMPQLNTNKLNTNKLNTNNNIYIHFGEFKRIKLTQEEYDKLIIDYDKSYVDFVIERLDEYVESNNNKNKYKNFNLVIRKAIRERWYTKEISRGNTEDVINEFLNGGINE